VAHALRRHPASRSTLKHAIELNPAYVQVAIERWQTFTGKQATLEGDGRSFEAIKRERVAAGAPSQ
jgi:DNA modification methylase